MQVPNIKPDTTKALYLAKRQLSELVTDAVNLEGINMTLPEVQTLLDGVTVGGHKLSDVTITLNQANTWKTLFQDIEKNTFEFTSAYANKLHSIAGKEEALKCGEFRDGNVTISGTDYLPPKPDKLAEAWEAMVEEANNLTPVHEKAICVFLQMARNQFYFDVNKRMGRFMMNGLLLAAGYPAINVPAKRQLEFNQLMLDFYPSNNMQPMTVFLISCIPQSAIDFMQS